MTAGLLVVDKPAGWTSHDVVARVRRLAGTRRVGHAGTLDPMATGVLVIGVERATRLLTHLTGATKSYTGTIRLGEATVTDDAEGQVTDRADALAVAAVTPQRLASAVARLTGEIQQVPSAVSAIKVAGRRSYARVRAGEDVELEPRRVTVSRFEVLESRRDATGDGTAVLDVDVRVDCSSGTYVRALARDLGADLGVGGHLTVLRRTRVGPYALDVARTLDELAVSFSLLSLEEAARAAFPVRELDAEETRRLRHGMRVAASPAGAEPGLPVAAFAPDGSLIALICEQGSVARPVLVVAPA
ncbi:MAG TPA: tRNA pseudouridine(55) synthase TruB [Kineosporiaceae bacterium]